jgi:hypothetical protein
VRRRAHRKPADFRGVQAGYDRQNLSFAEHVLASPDLYPSDCIAYGIAVRTMQRLAPAARQEGQQLLFAEVNHNDQR